MGSSPAMKLKDLNGIPALAISEIGEKTIHGLTSDSRLVERGFLFAALKGSKPMALPMLPMLWRAVPS